MYKVPTKYKRAISQELKRFVPLIHNLQARGKSSSEDDARILLNDVLGKYFYMRMGSNFQ